MSQQPSGNKARGWLEEGFESILFNSRIIVIIAVIGGVFSSILMFVRGGIQIAGAGYKFLQHPIPVEGHEHAGEELAITLISSVDSFLFATVLLIFAMGTYELFISKIDPASRTPESRPNWLAIHSLDDLKAAIGKVVLMILIVRLFETAVRMNYETPLHLVWLGVAVLFVSIALYLQHSGHHKSPSLGDAHPSLRPPPVPGIHPQD